MKRFIALALMLVLVSVASPASASITGGTQWSKLKGNVDGAYVVAEIVKYEHPPYLVKVAVHITLRKPIGTRRIFCKLYYLDQGEVYLTETMETFDWGYHNRRWHGVGYDDDDGAGYDGGNLRIKGSCWWKGA